MIDELDLNADRYSKDYLLWEKNDRTLLVLCLKLKGYIVMVQDS